ncbi:MAG: hypothetical protein ABH950_09745 [Candidatus Altiarchaeota archaeon]
MEKGYYTLVILIALGLLSYTTIYTFHSEYKLPFHSDEWDHLTYSLEILSKEKIVSYNPYLGPEFEDFNWELNYYLLFVPILLLTGLDPLKLAIFFPTITAFIMSLNAVLLVRHLTKNDISGLLAGILVLTLKSNVTLLGPWFLVPMAYGLSQIPLILYLFTKFLEKNLKWIIPFGLVFAQTTFVHAQTTTIFLPIFGVYLIMHPRTLWKNRWKILPLPLIGLLILMNFFPPAEQGANPEYFLKILEDTIDRLSLTSDEPSGYNVYYYYPRFLGESTILFSLIGIFVLLSSGKQEQRILPIAILSLTPFVIQYYYTQTIFLSYYRRMFMYDAELLLMAAGVGLAVTYVFVWEKSKKYIQDDLDRLLAKALVTVLLGLFLYSQIQSTFEYEKMIYHIIEERDVSALKWMKENTNENATVFAMAHISKAITPIAERRVIALTHSRLGAPQERNQDSGEFYVADCERKKEILEKYKPDYVFHKGVITCSFLELAHSEQGNFIYKVDLG